MSIFSGLFKTAIGVVTLPVSLTADVVLTVTGDKPAATEASARAIGEGIEEILGLDDG